MEQPNLKPEAWDIIHQICAKAIIRAIDNGTYKRIDELNTEKAEEADPSG